LASKKYQYKDGEVALLGGEAVLYLVKDTWYLRCWLPSEKKYARKSLRTKSLDTAEERGKLEFYRLQTDINSGRKYFSIDIKQGVALYLEFRRNEIITERTQGGIVAGRWKTLETHLQHFLAFVHKDTKITHLIDTQLLKYPQWRRKTATKGKVADSTIRNEIASINACMTYLHDVEKQADFRKFQIPKNINTTSNVDFQKIRRQTFTNDEWNGFVKAMRRYAPTASVKNAHKDAEAFDRLLVRYFCLFAANSALRTGEQRNLTWENLSTEKEGNKLIAKVTVALGTSKRRHNSREFWCRGGEAIETWKEIANHSTGLVFSRDGVEEFPKSSLHKHFNKILEEAVAVGDIDDERATQLVPYSMRHFCITQRIMAGLSYSEVGDAAGTSVYQIEKTYYHLNDAMKRKYATADYKLVDGVPKPLL